MFHPYRYLGRAGLAGFLLLVCGPVHPGQAAAWNEFRGPTGQGLSTATQVPVSWSTTNNIVWKMPVPGQGWSSPLLSEGRLYLTSAIDDPAHSPSLRVLCLSAADGRILWNTEALLPEANDVKAMHRKNSLASATPFLVGGRLYAHFGHMGTAALDTEGKVLWRQTGVEYPPFHGNGGSPVVSEGLVIFNCDGTNDPFMTALDAATGEVAWKSKRESTVKNKFSFCTPLMVQVKGVKELISPASGYVGGYDPRTGDELWRVNYGEGFSIVPRPVFAHGMIFVSSGFERPVLHAIKVDGARGDVTTNNVAWTHAKGVSTTPSFLVVDDELYMVSDAGIASCLDARSGKLHWSERLGGNFSASPVSAEGRIYFQNESGVGFVVKASTSFELLARNDLAEPSLASYAVADGTFFIRTAEHLWRVGEKSARDHEVSK